MSPYTRILSAPEPKNKRFRLVNINVSAGYSLKDHCRSTWEREGDLKTLWTVFSLFLTLATLVFLVCEEVGVVLIFCFHITKYLPRIAPVFFLFRSTAGADNLFLNGMKTPIPCFCCLMLLLMKFSLNWVR